MPRTIERNEGWFFVVAGCVPISSAGHGPNAGNQIVSQEPAAGAGITRTVSTPAQPGGWNTVHVVIDAWMSQLGGAAYNPCA